MKNKYSNNFKSALKALEKAGLTSITNYCKTNPDFGKTPKEREFNSWVHIISFFVEACYNSDSQKIYNKRMQVLVNYFFSIPIQYREKVYRQVNSDLKHKDMFFSCEPVGYLY